MRSSTLIIIASIFAQVFAGTTKAPCTGGKSATAAGVLGASETFSRTTTRTSTITVCPSCSHTKTHPHPSHPTSKSGSGGELTSKSKPTWTPTGGPTTLSSKAGGWTSAAYGNHSTTTTEVAATTVAGVSTSAGKTAAAPTSSLTAGVGRVEMGWVGGLVVGIAGMAAGLL